MDNSALTQAMKASISEVLEQMFFMTIDCQAQDGDSVDPQPVAGSIIAGIGFNGSPSGTFILEIPEDLARAVTADFLGAAARDLSAAQVAATVLEMLNMLAGGTLSRFDRQALYDLQMPELISADDLSALTDKSPAPIAFRIYTPQSRIMFQLMAR